VKPGGGVGPKGGMFFFFFPQQTFSWGRFPILQHHPPLTHDVSPGHRGRHFFSFFLLFGFLFPDVIPIHLFGVSSAFPLGVFSFVLAFSLFPLVGGFFLAALFPLIPLLVGDLFFCSGNSPCADNPNPPCFPKHGSFFFLGVFSSVWVWPFFFFTGGGRGWVLFSLWPPVPNQLLPSFRRVSGGGGFLGFALAVQGFFTFLVFGGVSWGALFRGLRFGDWGLWKPTSLLAGLAPTPPQPLFGGYLGGGGPGFFFFAFSKGSWIFSFVLLRGGFIFLGSKNALF